MPLGAVMTRCPARRSALDSISRDAGSSSTRRMSLGIRTSNGPDAVLKTRAECGATGFRFIFWRLCRFAQSGRTNGFRQNVWAAEMWPDTPSVPVAGLDPLDAARTGTPLPPEAAAAAPSLADGTREGRIAAGPARRADRAEFAE